MEQERLSCYLDFVDNDDYYIEISCQEAIDIVYVAVLSYGKYKIEDRNVVKTCKDLYKKLGEKTMSFTINCGMFPTSTFIVDKSKVEELKAKLVDYDIPNINIIEVDKDAFSEKKTNEQQRHQF